LGNGLVILAELKIDSGTAAVALATVPLWVAVITVASREERMTPLRLLGLLVGLGGVALLALGSGGAVEVQSEGLALALGAAVSWAVGSYYARRAPLPRRPLVMTAMQMLCGGGGLLVLAGLHGELAPLQLRTVPGSAWASFTYLVLPGSIVAYTAYAWLLRHAALSLVTTYAYISPVVAVGLGWLFAGEVLSPLEWLTAGAIVAGVACIVSGAPDGVAAATCGKDPAH
jgi:drug/metabolite transporter (DMT)-like permease